MERLEIDQELKQICNEIIKLNLSLVDWKKRESDDIFQTQNYEGGFDAIEEAFCFSYYDKSKKEYFLQFPLNDVKKILNGDINYIKIFPSS